MQIGHGSALGIEPGSLPQWASYGGQTAGQLVRHQRLVEASGDSQFGPEVGAPDSGFNHLQRACAAVFQLQ